LRVRCANIALRERRGGDSMTGGEVVGLDHVQVAAPRDPEVEAEARGFYGGLLGLAELEKPPALAARGGVWFACGAQQLHVGIEEPFAAARKAHPALRVAGLEALAERLVGAGVEVRWDAEIAGVARCYVDDPWGNRLELVAAEDRPVTPG
jgi:catechol 2,3-dioxygenase-like lactoylglutathione lyase family enzyme